MARWRTNLSFQSEVKMREIIQGCVLLHLKLEFISQEMISTSSASSGRVWEETCLGVFGGHSYCHELSAPSVIFRQRQP